MYFVLSGTDVHDIWQRTKDLTLPWKYRLTITLKFAVLTDDIELSSIPSLYFFIAAQTAQVAFNQCY